jgi:hypothetical protein
MAGVRVVGSWAWMEFSGCICGEYKREEKRK